MFNKKLNPDLYDQKLNDKIVKTLNRPSSWEPTKSLLSQIYDDFIYPNRNLIFFTIILIIFLCYRYRKRQTRLEEEMLNNISQETKENYDDLIIKIIEEQKNINTEPKIKPLKTTRMQMVPL